MNLFNIHKNNNIKEKVRLNISYSLNDSDKSKPFFVAEYPSFKKQNCFETSEKLANYILNTYVNFEIVRYEHVPKENIIYLQDKFRPRIKQEKNSLP